MHLFLSLKNTELMMINDFSLTFLWWGVFFVLGMICLPLTFVLLGKFVDRGYIFAKVLGMILVAYPVWLLGSIHVLPFGKISIYLFLTVLFGVNLLILTKKRDIFKKIPIKLLLFEEILFLLCLFFWAYVRATNPEIKGLEKFMDFGFVNSILRTDFFPPRDMWMPPLPINYYYFGHLITAILTILTGIDSAISYNLMLAVLFAFCFVGSFSLTMNLIMSFTKSGDDANGLRSPIFAGFVSGLVSAFLCALGGNLHTIIYVIKNGAEKYWFPDATRYIPFTIHEFPIYSFVVSDLHGHVLDIPLVLLILALLLSFYTTRNKFILPILGLTLGCSYMTNAWNLPIYLLISGIVFLYLNSHDGGNSYEVLTKTLKTFFFVFIISVLADLPFHLAFKQIAKGVALVTAHSPLYQLLVLWGFPLFITLSFIIFLFGERIVSKLKKESIVKGVASFFGVNVQIIKERAINIYPKIAYIDGFVLILLVVSWVLIIFPELFYIKDIYIKEYHRANTMFKFVYQSFILFSLASGYIVSRILFYWGKRSKFWKKIWYLIFALGFTSLLIYPYFTINSFYNGLKIYKGLNGISYLSTQNPGDYQVILWMKKNIAGQPVILEAVGDSYTDYARISANTGIPTVLGWPVHEWLWRGSYDEAGKRTGEVARMYESDNLTEVKDLLNKYKVQYVVVGNLERQKYKNIKNDNFQKLGKVIFDGGETKLYKIN